MLRLYIPYCSNLLCLSFDKSCVLNFHYSLLFINLKDHMNAFTTRKLTNFNCKAFFSSMKQNHSNQWKQMTSKALFHSAHALYLQQQQKSCLIFNLFGHLQRQWSKGEQFLTINLSVGCFFSCPIHKDRWCICIHIPCYKKKKKILQFIKLNRINFEN